MAHWGRGRYTQHRRRSTPSPTPKMEEQRVPDGASATDPQEGSPKTSPTVGSSSGPRVPVPIATSSSSPRLNAASGSAIKLTTRKPHSQTKRDRSPTPEKEDLDGRVDVSNDMSIPRHPPGKKLRFKQPKSSRPKDKGKSRARESDDESEREPEHRQHDIHISKRIRHGYCPSPEEHSKSVKDMIEDGDSGPIATIEGSLGGQFHSGRFKDLENEMIDFGGLDPRNTSFLGKDEEGVSTVRKDVANLFLVFCSMHNT